MAETIPTEKMRTSTTGRETVFAIGLLIGLAGLTLGLYRLYEQLEQVNEHLEVIERHAHGTHVEAMNRLEEREASEG